MWPDPRVEELVTREFITVRVHVKEHSAEFQRLGQKYGAEWTPATLMLDPSGAEQHRIEGFLPAPEFIPQLVLGLGRIDFAHGDYDEAERRFRSVASDFPDSDAAPEAVYWGGVARYKKDADSGTLRETAVQLRQRYPQSTWTKKASVWDGG